MEILKQLENAVILNKDNREFLGLSTGLTNRGTAGTNFSDLRRGNGYINRESGIEAYNLPEIIEIEGSVIIYSEDVKLGLRPLFNGDNDLQTLRDLLQFILKLKEQGVEIDGYASNLIYKTDNDELLMLPPRIIHFLNDRKSLIKKEEDVTIYRHPDLIKDNSLLFSIGIILFQITTNSYPVIYTDVEDLRDKIRRGNFLKPIWKNIKLSMETVELLDILILQKEEITPTKCLKELDELISDGTERTDIDYQDEIILNNKDMMWFIKKQDSRAFLIKYRGILAGSGILLLVLTVFFGSIISNALKPPKTTGFTPNQVVESYFNSFQLLDTELISDVLKKGVRKHDESEIATRYVTIKMRSQNNPNPTSLSPKKWLELPDQEKSLMDVYGIHNLEIKELNQLQFRVNYEKWYKTPDENSDIQDTTMIVFKVIREEILTLVETKYSYQVTDIETLSEVEERVW